MKVKEIRDLSEAELRQKLEDAQKEMFNLRAQQTTGQLENPARIRVLRRDAARILTVINAKKTEAKS